MTPKEHELLTEARKLNAFYKANGVDQIVTLWAEDYDTLVRGGLIRGGVLDGDFPVKKGPHKKKRSRRRPPDSII